MVPSRMLAIRWLKPLTRFCNCWLWIFDTSGPGCVVIRVLVGIGLKVVEFVDVPHAVVAHIDVARGSQAGHGRGLRERPVPEVLLPAANRSGQ